MIGCRHTDRVAAGRVCSHLLGNSDPDHVQRFTEVGLAYDLVCEACGKNADAIDSLIEVCSECFRGIEAEGAWEGIVGRPEVCVGVSGLRFQHEMLELPSLADVDIVDVQPVDGVLGRWMACTSTGLLIQIDLGSNHTGGMAGPHQSHHTRETSAPHKTNYTGETPVPQQSQPSRVVARIPQEALDFDGAVIRETRPAWVRGPRCVLRVSPRGEMAAVANTYGERGVVIDLVTGAVTMNLRRDSYHSDICVFPLAFCEFNDRLVVIHATAWNRLDASDAKTGELLTPREPIAYQSGKPLPPHHLDYFHSGLTVSPGQQFMADNGWVWQPLGIVKTWSLRRWLGENVWESEDGPTKQSLCHRAYYWDGPLCWIDDYRLAVWGYGLDDEWLVPAVQIFDVRSGERERWFAGPKGSLVFDDYLFSFDGQEGMAVWDVETGERVLHEAGFCPAGYHRGSKHFLSVMGGGRLRVSRVMRN